MNTITHPNLDFPKHSSQMQYARRIVRDLFEPRVHIYWTDLLLSATAGWSAFVFACLVTPLTWQMWGGTILAAIAFYRALIFTHELTHLKATALPGFRPVWNLLVGVPLLLPSFTMEAHADHHRPSSYGTNQDPEYMPFNGKKGAIILFVVHSLFLPFFFALRFLVLSPLGLVFPPFHRYLECHASTLSMNLTYCRRVSEIERTSMMALELLILGMWSIPIGLAASGIFSWRIFAIWYSMTSLIAVMNSLRTLGAHQYRSNGEPMMLENQLLDSVDIPGAPWTVIWAPLGMRFHALHHYFPNMPYHNLSTAHQRLIATLPSNSPYYRSISPSLWNTLQGLWQGTY